MILKQSLTIAVPTYKRPEVCFELARELCLSEATVDIHLLFVDDGPSDGLLESLTGLGSLKLRVLQHAENEGYARTFAQIFEEVRTDWVLVLADDDELIFGNLLEARRYLEDTDLDIVVPQFLNADGQVSRGRTTFGTIYPQDLRAAFNHAPGIFYRKEAMALPISYLSQQLVKGNLAAEVYPQVVAGSFVVLYQNAGWLPIPLVREGKDLPSNIKDPFGDHYSSTDSRVRQALSFDSLFRDLVESSDEITIKRRARTFVRCNELNVIWAIREQASAYSPKFIRFSYLAVTRFVIRQVAKFFTRGIASKMRAIGSRTASG